MPEYISIAGKCVYYFNNKRLAFNAYGVLALKDYLDFLAADCSLPL